MSVFIIKRSLRSPQTTTLAGLVAFKRLTEQLDLLSPLDAEEFKKAHGHSMRAIFLALVVKALMGTPSMDEFEDKLNDEEFVRKIVGLTKKLGKTVLGRNMKRFKLPWLRDNYSAVVSKLIALNLVTLEDIGIDSTFIEVWGENYQKATKSGGPNKAVWGYRLHVAFDLASKIPVAYILTFGHKHDSQFLIPLIEIIKSQYGVSPTQVVIDKAYYGQAFFQYLTDQGIGLVIPAKKYQFIKHAFSARPSQEFQRSHEYNLQYADDHVQITGYGYIRAIWLVCGEVDEWMPEDLKPRDWWGLLTNRADLTPLEVVQAYKERWEVEVFFRSIKQRMALARLPGQDFRQIQVHIFFCFIGYILLMLVRHVTPLDVESRCIGLKIVQESALFVKAVFEEKNNHLNVYLTAKEWLYYHEEEITLI